MGRPFLCYRPLEEAPAVGPLPAREAGYVTFASFNNFAKVNPRVIERWARILVAVPGARLRLKSAALGDAAIAGDVADRFASFGVARERLVLAGRTPRAGDHLAQYREVDIALDPFPYGGTTTSCESLWMGVPVVSERGARHAGRVGAALLEGIGLGELVADGADDYVAKAAALAGDLERLALLRAELRARMERSPLCDAAGFARALERTYRELFTRWCAG